MAAVEGLVTIGVPYLFAKFATALVPSIPNYVVARRWVFRQHVETR